MVLVTGATGFVGRVLVRILNENGYDVRVLIRPSPDSPDLPRGVPVEVVVAGLNDERGLRAAMVDVDVVYHLAGTERRGVQADLLGVDIEGTRNVARAAAQARVDRLFVVSHLGADRASAYPLLKAKGIMEDYVRRSGVDYTIMRSAMLFGDGDHFTTGLAKLIHAQPYIFALPGDGFVALQPLWVDDLATCMVWGLDIPETRNQVFELGGPEYFTFREIVEAELRVLGVDRRLISIPPPYLRALTVVVGNLFPRFPISTFWLDYLASNRTTGLDTIPRTFGLLPARFPTSLDYLKKYSWRKEMIRSLLRRNPKDGRR